MPQIPEQIARKSVMRSNAPAFVGHHSICPSCQPPNDGSETAATTVRSLAFRSYNCLDRRTAVSPFHRAIYFREGAGK